jgi:hypothetical protein
MRPERLAVISRVRCITRVQHAAWHACKLLHANETSGGRANQIDAGISFALDCRLLLKGFRLQLVSQKTFSSLVTVGAIIRRVAILSRTPPPKQKEWAGEDCVHGGRSQWLQAALPPHGARPAGARKVTRVRHRLHHVPDDNPFLPKMRPSTPP